MTGKNHGAHYFMQLSQITQPIFIFEKLQKIKRHTTSETKFQN